MGHGRRTVGGTVGVAGWGRNRTRSSTVWSLWPMSAIHPEAHERNRDEGRGGGAEGDGVRECDKSSNGIGKGSEAKKKK